MVFLRHPYAGAKSVEEFYPYSDTSKTCAPNIRIYEHIKGRFPRRWRPPNRDSTWAILGDALKCRCRVRWPLLSLCWILPIWCPALSGYPEFQAAFFAVAPKKP